MKLRLNQEAITDDFFEETRLLGIMAPIKNYQFCWQLNNLLGYNFRLSTDIEVQMMKKGRKYYFSLYHHVEKNSFLNHYIYHNHCNGEYLLPEFRHMDFLWLMKDDVVDDSKCMGLTTSIKSIAGVQLVAELTNEKIKNKGNLVF
ncbi:MAG: IPExxxVDY family protein [Chitinophagaceae bacterium]|nr:IPExxxVDY family protein [Chitinophagaceae bacterium]